jgi:hypothetical protein
MLEKKKIDIKDLPFAHMEEGMCTHCGCRLSTTKMDELAKLEDLTCKGRWEHIMDILKAIFLLGLLTFWICYFIIYYTM